MSGIFSGQLLSKFQKERLRWKMVCWPLFLRLPPLKQVRQDWWWWTVEAFKVHGSSIRHVVRLTYTYFLSLDADFFSHSFIKVWYLVIVFRPIFQIVHPCPSVCSKHFDLEVSLMAVLCIKYKKATGCSLNIVFFSKYSRKFATSPLPQLQGGYHKTDGQDGSYGQRRMHHFLHLI